jgi:hypothetical protein
LIRAGWIGLFKVAARLFDLSNESTPEKTIDRNNRSISVPFVPSGRRTAQNELSGYLKV